MSSFELLSNHIVQSNQYNGSLSEFIDSSYNKLTDYNEFFIALEKAIPDVKIFTGYTVLINQNVPSNIVIRYKDAFKLNNYGISVPAIIYFKNDEFDRAIVLTDKHYIEAKGLYCSITEPQSELEAVRDEIIALPLNYDQEKLLKTFEDIYHGARLMSIKKTYDHEILNSVDEMKEFACQYSRDCFEHDKEVLLTLQDKRDYINNAVVRTFLLKKAVYVQYMSSKDLLMNRHEGNVSEQRRFAKTYASDIPFIPIGRLFHPEEKEEPSEE